MSTNYVYGTGRRKTAVARVRLLPGDGSIIVNGKPVPGYLEEQGVPAGSTTETFVEVMCSDGFGSVVVYPVGNGTPKQILNCGQAATLAGGPLRDPRAARSALRASASRTRRTAPGTTARADRSRARRSAGPAPERA